MPVGNDTASILVLLLPLLLLPLPPSLPLPSLANGLAHLRHHQFTHRDIKPGNIMRCQKPDGT